jgi:hypothetical protein
VSDGISNDTWSDVIVIIVLPTSKKGIIGLGRANFLDIHIQSLMNGRVVYHISKASDINKHLLNAFTLLDVLLDVN